MILEYVARALMADSGRKDMLMATVDGIGADVLLADTALHPVGLLFGDDWRGHIGWELW
jgi:hypothetical protein